MTNGIFGYIGRPPLTRIESAATAADEIAKANPASACWGITGFEKHGAHMCGRRRVGSYRSESFPDLSVSVGGIGCIHCFDGDLQAVQPISRGSIDLVGTSNTAWGLAKQLSITHLDHCDLRITCDEVISRQKRPPFAAIIHSLGQVLAITEGQPLWYVADDSGVVLSSGQFDEAAVRLDSYAYWRLK